MEHIDLSSIMRDPIEVVAASGDTSCTTPSPTESFQRSSTPTKPTDPTTRQRNLSKINAYLTQFPTYATMLAPFIAEAKATNWYDAYTDTEIEEKQKQIYNVLNTRVDANAIHTTADAIFGSIEAIGCLYTPLRIQGFQKAMQTDDVRADLTLLYIESEFSVETTPVQRITMAMVVAAGKLHWYNKPVPADPEKLEKLNESYSDI